MLVQQLKLSETVQYDIGVGRSSEHVVRSTTDVDTENLACSCSFKQTLADICFLLSPTYLQLNLLW